ncbi:MAG: MarR family transcriptional regulator [Lentilitoribacter sp.]|jgi:DNA-binding MarR family transcriptional regulator
MTDKSNGKIHRYNLNDQVGYLLRLAHQRHAEIFKLHTIEKLTPTQFSALLRISQQGKVSQNHLGRLAGMDVATVKGVVERLKDKGFVELKPDLEDKRRLVISLSDKGKSIVAGLEEIGANITEETLSPLNDAERATLVKLLQKIS